MTMLFHIYVGTKYHGPMRAKDEREAVRLYAYTVKLSPLIFHAKPAQTIQDLKVPESQRPFLPEY